MPRGFKVQGVFMAKNAGQSLSQWEMVSASRSAADPGWLRKPPESASGGLGLIRRGAEAPRRFCAVGAVLGKCRLHWGRLAGCEDSLGTPRGV